MGLSEMPKIIKTIVVAIIFAIIMLFFGQYSDINSKLYIGGDDAGINLFIFRRDFRIIDNTALNLAVKSGPTVCVFVFDDAQISAKNTYRAAASMRFMLQSLRELVVDVTKIGGKFNLLRGNIAEIIEKIAQQVSINGVFFNADYTPFAKNRDNIIAKICKKLNIQSIIAHDCLLLDEPKFNNSGANYKKFGPFYDEFSTQKIRKVNSDVPKNITNIDLLRYIGPKYEVNFDDFSKIVDVAKTTINGGRKSALALLKNVHTHENYATNRNNLNNNGTMLSPHNKFGTVSIREVHSAFTKITNSESRSALIRQLFWRDFYYNIMINDPRALSGNYDNKFDNMWKNNDIQLFTAWSSGKTGFPIVDACMIELNSTSYMHNRGRLIVADFLVKLLDIDWRLGEKYFAQHLVDYDPAQNNYNWQWVAGTGPFSQPYFRMFNPSKQSEKYDPDCDYIKKWLPQLAAVPPRDIHNWENTHLNYPNIDYPRPIISYKSAKLLYKNRIKNLNINSHI